MSAIRRLPYGQAATIDFHLYATDGTALKVDAAHAAGDTTLMKDEGAEANTTNGFVDEGKGYSIALTATELTAARVVLYVVDQGTQAWLDEVITIETYGHPSAQHPDEGVPQPDSGLITGTPTSTTAALGGNIENTDDLVNGAIIYFSAGTGLRQSRAIVDYDQTSDTVTVDPAWATTPDTTTVYHILPSPPATEAAANLPDTNAGAIGGDSGAADTLALSAAGIITGTAATGTLSTTQATTDLTGFADDQLIGRTIVFTGGAADGEATDITDYASASGLLTFTALTTAPGDADPFVIF